MTNFWVDTQGLADSAAGLDSQASQLEQVRATLDAKFAAVQAQAPWGRQEAGIRFYKMYGPLAEGTVNAVNTAGQSTTSMAVAAHAWVNGYSAAAEADQASADVLRG